MSLACIRELFVPKVDLLSKKLTDGLEAMLGR